MTIKRKLDAYLLLVPDFRLRNSNPTLVHRGVRKDARSKKDRYGALQES